MSKLNHDSTKIQLKTRLSNSETPVSEIPLDRGEPLFDAQTKVLHVGDDKGNKVSFLPSGDDNYLIIASETEYRIQAQKDNIKIVMEPGKQSHFEVTEDILPYETNSNNIGSSDLKFNEVYANEFIGKAVSYRNDEGDDETDGTIAKAIKDTNDAIVGAIQSLDSSTETLSSEQYLTGITITDGKISNQTHGTQTAVSVDTSYGESSTLTHGGTFKAVTAVKKGNTSHNIDVTPTAFTMPLETTLSVVDGKKSGNAVTSISVNHHEITVNKEKTFLTEHPSITPSTDFSANKTLIHSNEIDTQKKKTFTVIDGITKDTNGHITAVNRTTYTMPDQYTHPTGNGNEHVPEGKDINDDQVLRWSKTAQKAEWGKDKDTTYAAGNNISISGTKNSIALVESPLVTSIKIKDATTEKAELVYDGNLKAVKFIFK